MSDMGVVVAVAVIISYGVEFSCRNGVNLLFKTFIRTFHPMVTLETRNICMLLPRNTRGKRVNI